MAPLHFCLLEHDHHIAVGLRARPVHSRTRLKRRLNGGRAAYSDSRSRSSNSCTSFRRRSFVTLSLPKAAARLACSRRRSNSFRSRFSSMATLPLLKATERRNGSHFLESVRRLQAGLHSF